MLLERKKMNLFILKFVSFISTPQSSVCIKRIDINPCGRCDIFTRTYYSIQYSRKSRSCLNYGASTVSNASVQNKTQSPSLNKVSFVIVSSFCLFFIKPNILIVLLVTVPDVKVAEQYYKYLIFFHEVNVSMDALIYIWLSPRIKKLAIALFSLCHRCCYSTQSQVDSRNRQQPSTITSSIASVPDHCHETEFSNGFSNMYNFS